MALHSVGKLCVMGPLLLERPNLMCLHWDYFTLFVTYKTSMYLATYLSISDGILSQYNKNKKDIPTMILHFSFLLAISKKHVVNKLKIHVHNDCHVCAIQSFFIKHVMFILSPLFSLF